MCNHGNTLVTSTKSKPGTHKTYNWFALIQSAKCRRNIYVQHFVVFIFSFMSHIIIKHNGVCFIPHSFRKYADECACFFRLLAHPSLFKWTYVLFQRDLEYKMLLKLNLQFARVSIRYWCHYILWNKSVINFKS